MMATITFCRVSIKKFLGYLLLTPWAVENAPATKFFSQHHCITALAWKSLATVDKKCPLKAARLTCGIAKISIRCPAKPHCLFEHFFHRIKKFCSLSGSDFSDQPERPNPRPIEHFASVDITDTRDLVLFEEERRDALPTTSFQEGIKELLVTFIRERIDAKNRNRLHRLDLVRRD
jgi:hypothetical protein